MSRSGTNSHMILFLKFQKKKLIEERIQMDSYKYDLESVQKQEEKKRKHRLEIGNLYRNKKRK
jgi:hypothetical protein